MICYFFVQGLLNLFLPYYTSHLHRTCRCWCVDGRCCMWWVFSSPASSSWWWTSSASTCPPTQAHAYPSKSASSWATPSSGSTWWMRSLQQQSPLPSLVREDQIVLFVCSPVYPLCLLNLNLNLFPLCSPQMILIGLLHRRTIRIYPNIISDTNVEHLLRKDYPSDFQVSFLPCAWLSWFWVWLNPFWWWSCFTTMRRR